ncbi:Short chain dehydrogenase atnD [Hyphodiscus hymeniophilus]|uniref:Short chain dehydrogenase atnD n=1 Tax=Hyphodiscus hymeniophilus TaxID=353542 RepID=A0A9P6VDF9_9HELO|nr:Short chain dehydrogenase atnD [Hyphodiscus hymeniophilus]
MAPWVLSFLYSQLFVTIPSPTTSFAGQTIIVTGSNTGLGLEAAKHFVRLNASKVILAVRTPSKGQAAQRAIEASNPLSRTVIEVWELNLSSFKSVKAFAERVTTLDRLDVLLENAGMMTTKFKLVEGNECMITTNVLATEILALLVLPKLRETAEKFGVQPRLSIVTSDLHFVAKFKERHANPEDLFAALNSEEIADMDDRYAVSKLLEVFFVRELAFRIAEHDGKGPSVIVNCMTPGACHSDFMRELTGVGKWMFKLAAAIIARSTEVGSRTLLASASAGPESHGKYMADCQVTRAEEKLTASVMEREEFYANHESKEGREMQGRLWEQTMRKLEGIVPGVAKIV